MKLGALAFVLAVAGCGTPTPRGVELVPAPPSGEVPALVTAELARAHHDGRQLLVYVGATWCEPCRRFHAAAHAGQLNQVFPRLRLYEFDLDRDRDRLERAGYHSQLIPLFVRPNPDGRSSGRQIEGSVKGEAAVAQIAPRLQALLGP